MPEQLIEAASNLATHVLAGIPERLRHSAGVAGRAEALTAAVPPAMAETLIAAAWLHDIGYGPEVKDTGFHPLDGAIYLRREGWDETICDLVAHHSGSRFVARVRGLDGGLREFRYLAATEDDAAVAALLS